MNPIFWIGYHQDTTDLQGIAPQDTIKAGHYESLKKIDTADEQERIEDVVDKEIVSKLKTEESILKLLASNQSVVDSVIERLNLKVKPNDLLDADICYTLMTCVYPNYASETSTGKK